MEMDQVTLTQVMKFVDMLAGANPSKLDKATTRKIARSIFTVTAIARDAKMTSEMFADFDRFADTKLLPMMNSLVDLFEKHMPIPKPAFPTIGPMSMPPSCNDLAAILRAGGGINPSMLPDGRCRTGKRPMPAGRVQAALHPKKK